MLPDPTCSSSSLPHKAPEFLRCPDLILELCGAQGTRLLPCSSRWLHKSRSCVWRGAATASPGQVRAEMSSLKSRGKKKKTTQERLQSAAHHTPGILHHPEGLLLARGSVPVIPGAHFGDNSGLLWRLQDLSPDAVTVPGEVPGTMQICGVGAAHGIG